MGRFTRALRLINWNTRLPRWSIGIVILIGFVGYSLISGPTSKQIRLDTGDLRYCWWGICFGYQPMQEPIRSKLLALSAKSPAIEDKWVTCVRYPRLADHHVEVRYLEYYVYITYWDAADPTIARWILEDVTKSIESKTWGTPLVHEILSSAVIDLSARKLKTNWRENEMVRRYCAAHGYDLTTRATFPATTIVK